MLQAPRIYYNKIVNLPTKSYRQLWSYVAVAFNKVDNDRLKAVGPDRLCAEWVMKNGGAVCFVQSPGHFLRDYNALPPENKLLQIKEIDGTDSSIMKLGFEHLKSCKHIERIILHRCKHLENDGLEGLTHVKNTLKFLQISSCYNVDDQGLDVLRHLKQLKKLLLFDLLAVKNLNTIVGKLKTELSGCSITTECA